MKNNTYTFDNVFTSNSVSQRKSAFTLAEILITLAIIGVVAAMTLPSLIQEHREKETVARVKKAYSVLNQAYLLAKDEYGTVDEWGITTTMSDPQSHINFANKIKKYMNLSQDCVGMSDSDVKKQCTTQGYYSAPRTSSVVVLSDGSAIAFRSWNGTCNHNYNYVAGANKSLSRTCGEATLLTRPKYKNQRAGKEIFSFYITRDAIIPMGVVDDSHQFNKACNRTIPTPYPGFSSSSMFACTAWVIFNENMDFWHCDDLDWNGKTKCK